MIFAVFGTLFNVFTIGYSLYGLAYAEILGEFPQTVVAADGINTTVVFHKLAPTEEGRVELDNADVPFTTKFISWPCHPPPPPITSGSAPVCRVAWSARVFSRQEQIADNSFAED
jgi:hypothetical protein